MPLRFKRSPIVERIIASRRGRVPEKRSAYPRYVESERPSVRDLVEPDPGRWSTLGDKWGDVIPSLASAGVGIAQNFTDLIPGGGASRLGQAERYAQDYWQKKFSPEHQAELDRQEREKEAVGTWSEHPLDRAGLLARQVIRNPKTSAAEMIGQYVPIMGVGGAIRGVGGLAAKAGAARGATAAGKALTKAGALAEPSVAAQATGAGLGVGAVRSGIFDSTLEALKSQGVPEAEAMRRAERAQAYTSNPALFAGAAVVGKYVAKFGEDAALLKLAGKKDVVAQEGLRALTDAAKGAGVRGLITGFGREALTEAPEEFIQNVASNVGARGAGALISPWKDAGDAAIKAGLMAGPMGSIGHVGSARDAKRQLETLQPPGTPPPGAPTGAPPVDTGEAPSDTQAALNAAVARVRARRLTGDVAPNFTVEDALTTPPEQIKLTAAEAVNDPRVQEIMSRFPTPSENKNDPALKALMDSGLMTGLAQAQKAIVRFRQGLTPLQLPGQSPVADEAQPVAPGEMALPGPVEAASAPEALPPGPVTEVQDQTLERGTEQGTQIGTEGQPAVAPLDQGARSEVSGADRVAEDRARTVSEEPIMKGRDAGESRGRPGALVADQAPKAVEAHAESVPAAIQAEAEKAEPEPTTAQKDAGNYTKGHIKWNGLDVSIETPRGGTRRAVDGSWTVENMPAHYGYVRRTEGADGEQVDIYMGDSPGSGRVFVVDQKDAETGKFDETKTMLGFNTPEAARAAYVAAFSDGKGPQRIQALTETTVDGFKSWLKAKHDGAFARKAPKIKIAPIKPKRAGKQDLGAALASDTLSPEMRAAIEEAKKNPQKGRMAEPRVAPKAKKAETVKPVNVEAATGLDTEQVATARADATALRKGINEAKGVATIQSAMSPFHFTDIQRYAPQIKYSELPKATKDLAKAGGRKPDTLKRGERGAVVAKTGIRRSETRGTSREDVIALDVQLEQLISDGWFPAGSTVDDLVNALVSKTPYYHPAETQGADAAVLANEVWKETGISPAAQATAIKQDKGNPKEVKILKALAELDPNDSQVQLEEKRADEPGDAQEDVRFSTERTKAGVQNLLPGAQGMMDTTGRVGKIKRKGQEDVSRGPLFTQDEEAEKKADAAKQTTLFAAGPFFSQLEKAAEAMKQPMRGADALRYLLDPQRAKPEETFWTGLDEWLGMEVSRPVQVKGQKGQQALVFKITDPVKAGRKVTPAEIQEFLKANAVTVTEVTKGATDDSEIESWWNDEGGANEETPFNDLTSEQVREARSRYEDEVGRFAEDGTAPKFGPNTHPSMSIPGGENYREVLLTLPEKPLAIDFPPYDEWLKDEILAGYHGPEYEAQNRRVYESDRERAISIAEAERRRNSTSFTGGHFDETNVLAHVRLNDRNVDGEKVLFVEEIQSDWAQKGRKEGFSSKPEELTDARKSEISERLIVLNRDINALLDKHDVGRTEDIDGPDNERAAILLHERRMLAAEQIGTPRGKIPSAPFVEDTTDWVNLAMKSILHKAAAEGYDAVAWTPGSVQNERYDLSKQVERIEAFHRDDGTFDLMVFKKADRSEFSDINGLTPAQLESTIGKDLAAKIVEQPKQGMPGSGWKSYSGPALKIEGHGMREFYDRIVPQVAQKLAKKWGAKVGTMNLAYPGGSDVGGQPIRRLDPGERTQEKVIVQSIPITTEMRSSVTQEGFPLFKAGEKAAPVPVTISKVRKAIPGLPWKAQPDGSFTASLKDGRTLKLDPNASFLSLTTKEQTGFERSATAAGGNASERAPVGAYTPFGLSREALIRVATAAPGGTLEHEGLHFLWDVALTPQEKASLVKRFGGEEEAAYAFATWLTAEQRKPQTLFQKVLDFVKRLVHYFKPTWESTFKEAASGRAAGRVGKSTGGSSFAAAARRVTETAAFKKWFGKSVVVDADGNPLVLYHGTGEEREFTVFDLDHPNRHDTGWLGTGVYLTRSPGIANAYASFKRGVSDRVMPLFAKIENPYIATLADKERIMLISHRDKAAGRAASDKWTRELKAKGHDGVILDFPGKDSQSEYIVFDPAGVKSATGNRGTFDANNPDIRFSTAEADFEGDASMGSGTPRPPGTATLGYEPMANMEETFIEKLQHLFQNKLNSVRRLQETVKKTRPEKASKIDHEAAFIGVDPRAAASVDNVGAVVITPMIELIHRKKLDQALLGRFSMAMHAPAADKAIIDENLIHAAELERDPPPGDTTDKEGKKIPAPQRAPFTVEEAIRELGPKRVKEIKDSLPPNPSGMSTERVAEILQKVKDSGKREAYEQARQMILDIQSITNQLRIRMGLTTAETVAQWEAKYGPDFVHLWNADKGVLESFMNSGRGVSVRGPEVLRRRGRRSEADADPMISALQDLERTIIRSEKNRSVDDFAEWISSLKEPQIAFVRKGQPTEQGVGFKRDGQQWTIEIPGDPRLLGQLKSLTTPQIDLMTNTLGHFTRYFSRINTAYSPPFLIRNGVRDYAGAIISSMILHGVKGHKGNKAVWREVMKNQYPAMRGSWNFQQDPAKQWPEGSWEAYAAEGVRLGAVPGFFNVVESMSKIEDRLVAELKKKMTAAELRDLGVTEAKDIIADKNLYKIVKAGKLSKIAVDTAFRSLGLRAAGEMLLDANKMVEMATRINYFTALRKSGVAAKEAANLARNLTDFNKRGEFTSMLNSVWSFFNANVQGTVRIAEMMTSKDPAVKARANAMFAGIIGAGVMWDVMLAAISGDDDDDGIPDSDQMPQWATERNFVIPAMGNFAPILIPLAQGFNVPFFAGQMLSKSLRGVPGFSPGKAALSVMGAAADSWGPIGTKYGVPTALQPGVEVLGNEDWAGRQVTPTRYPGMEGIPDSRLAWKWTSPMAKASAEILGSLTKGDETVPGLVDISPATIDHFARYFAGGAGRFMEDTVSSGLSLLEGETPEKVPGLSSFTLNEDSAKRARYYDQQRELSILGAQLKNKERVALTEEAEARGYDVGKATLPDLRKAITTLAPERQKWLLDSYRRLDARRLGLKDMMDAADKAVKELNSRPKTPQTEAALEAIYRRVNKAFVKASEGIR